MRFVTGAQNPTNYAIKTPVARLRHPRHGRQHQDFVISNVYRSDRGIGHIEVAGRRQHHYRQGRVYVVSSNGAGTGRAPTRARTRSDRNARRIEIALTRSTSSMRSMRAITCRRSRSGVAITRFCELLFRQLLNRLRVSFVLSEDCVARGNFSARHDLGINAAIHVAEGLHQRASGFPGRGCRCAAPHWWRRSARSASPLSARVSPIASVCPSRSNSFQAGQPST